MKPPAPVEDLKPPLNAATRFVSEPASNNDRALLRRCRTWYSTVLRSRRGPWVLAKQSSPSPSTTSAAPARAMLHHALPHARSATRACGRTDEAQGLVDGGVVSGARRRACDGARGRLQSAPALARPSALAPLAVGSRAQPSTGRWTRRPAARCLRHRARSRSPCGQARWSRGSPLRDSRRGWDKACAASRD